MGSAKSGLSAAWFDKFFAHGQAHMGQMGKWPKHCRTADLYKSMKLQMGKSIHRFQRYAFHKVCTQFVANLTRSGPWASRWANDQGSAQVQAWTIPQNFEQRKSVKRLQRYGFRNFGSCLPSCPAAWLPSCPPTRTVMTIPLQPGRYYHSFHNFIQNRCKADWPVISCLGFGLFLCEGVI